MANEAMKKRIKENKKILLIWSIVSLIFCSLSAFLIFYKRKNTPKLQNKNTFYFGLTVMLIGFFLAIRSIRVMKDKNNQFVTTGNLKEHGAILIDLIGISLLVQFVGVWWSKASWILLIVPVYVVYNFVKKLVSWLQLG